MRTKRAAFAVARFTPLFFLSAVTSRGPGAPPADYIRHAGGIATDVPEPFLPERSRHAYAPHRAHLPPRRGACA
ncbi:hypothetical protein A9Z05_26425 [Burkholderia sp. A2]|nr:hypothetical protein A9Z05_26425 [Burkholderia sp. A2]